MFLLISGHRGPEELILLMLPHCHYLSSLWFEFVYLLVLRMRKDINNLINNNNIKKEIHENTTCSSRKYNFKSKSKRLCDMENLCNVSEKKSRSNQDNFKVQIFEVLIVEIILQSKMKSFMSWYAQILFLYYLVLEITKHRNFSLLKIY